jgi:hypothetical protein
MTALFRAGRQTDALQAYLRARTTLVKRYNTEPGQVLRALHQRILAGDSTVGLLSGPAGTGSARAPYQAKAPAAFVGRSGAVAELRASVEDLLAGQGGCVWIEGPAGSGKSALLAEGLAGATAAACTVSWARADEFGQPIACHAIERCLSDIGAALSQGATVRVERAAETSLESELEHVRRVIGSHVGRPLVMVLDDLQWADRESLAVWHYLRGLTQQRALLLVSACRPLPRHRDLDLLRELAEDSESAQPGSRRSKTIVLPPLTDVESRELLDRLAPEARPSARMITSLAGGNPSYLLAMAAAVEAHGQARTWKTVPPPVAAAVAEHFGHLSEQTREALRAMALLGDVCSVEDLMSATGMVATGLVDILAEALTVGALRELDTDLRFAHPLLRRVLYESVPESLRLAVYQQFAT